VDETTRVARLERTRAAMAERDVAALAVSPSDDLRYLLGFSPTADERLCLLLLGPTRMLIVVPGVNAEQMRAAVPGIELVRWADADGPTAALADALAQLELEGGTIGVDGTMRADSLLQLEALRPAARYVPAAEVLGALRVRKDEAELDALRASARTADTAVQAALAACTGGRMELEVAEVASATFLREGCEEATFAFVASGPNGAFPHHHSGRRVLRRGESITVDVGGRLEGYASDITRMAYVGEPDEEYLRVHAAVEAAVQAALATVEPGVRCGDVDAAARGAVEEAGLGTFFVHRTGHGLGLSGHEPPWIMAGEQTRLEPGMVFSIEPGVYLPGRFGVRLEEIVAVTADGCEILSGLSRAPFVTG
jgi:Xaa-Pro aminopeptidase